MSDTTSQAPVLDLLARMTADSLAASNLPVDDLMLVRIAALVAVDAGPASYAMNLQAAAEAGLDADTVRGVLAAIAPIVGTARIISATTKMARALGIDLDLPEFGEDSV
jgi:alkylhydroperoxidase/carboxymuconolactone decarboxylase family protein YurZ